ncbi:unnamed protein product [Effrenium voratum]|nr:unnamed protein product [Effrenium voratum]
MDDAQIEEEEGPEGPPGVDTPKPSAQSLQDGNLSERIDVSGYREKADQCSTVWVAIGIAMPIDTELLQKIERQRKRLEHSAEPDQKCPSEPAPIEGYVASPSKEGTTSFTDATTPSSSQELSCFVTPSSRTSSPEIFSCRKMEGGCEVLPRQEEEEAESEKENVEPEIEPVELWNANSEKEQEEVRKAVLLLWLPEEKARCSALFESHGALSFLAAAFLACCAICAACAIGAIRCIAEQAEGDPDL